MGGASRLFPNWTRRGDRVQLSLRDKRLDRLEANPLARLRMRRGITENRLTALHQPGCQIDNIADHGVLAAPRAAPLADKRQTGGDADAALDADWLEHAREPHCSQRRSSGVVLAGLQRQPPDCDDRRALLVDHDLIDAAAE